MGKAKLDHVDKSKVDKVITTSLKMAVTDLIISRYASESQTYVVTKDATSVDEAADDLIDYARHMSSGKYMYAILAGIDKEFTHECVAEFIRNSPVIMDQIRSNASAAAGSAKRGDVVADLHVDTMLNDPKVSEDIVSSMTDDDVVESDTDQIDVEVDSKLDTNVRDFIFDPTEPNGIKWKN